MASPLCTPKNVAIDESGRVQLGQSLGEHRVANTNDLSSQFGESQRSIRECAEDNPTPALP